MNGIENILNLIAGGNRTYKLDAGVDYTGAGGLFEGFYATAEGAEFTVLSDERGNDLRPAMGLSTPMVGIIPLHKTPRAAKSITCSVECVLLLANNTDV